MSNTVNQNITLVIEETPEEIFIKPSNICDENVMNKCICASFNPSHICDNENCSCITFLKDLNVNNIVHLNLTRCNLKSLPNCVRNLPLKSLDLSNNSLKLPPECLFLGLNNLEVLNLSNNLISEFETEPKCVLNLRILNLANNLLKYIPIWIVHGKSMNLTELYYNHNCCGKTDEYLYNKINTYNLKKMALQNSRILNENIPFLKSVKTLELLDVSNNNTVEHSNIFTNYEELFENPSWKNTINILAMSNLHMAFIPDSICLLLKLKELHLSKNDIVWLPESIGQLINLEILDISENSLCFLPQSVKGLEKLRVLKLEKNNLADVDAAGELRLDILDLYENDLDNINFDVTKFKLIDVERNYFPTNALSADYINQRDNYRKDFSLQHRILGHRNEHVDDDLASSSAKSLSSDPDEPNIIPDRECDEECWDDNVKIKSHPDVTSSDDEWQGYFPIQKKQSPKPKENFDHLLEYLYVDVD